MLVTFLGRSCASLFLSHSNSSGYFTLMSFTKKRAFMFSHFFPLYFLFSIVPFSITTATATTLSAIQQRERDLFAEFSALSLARSLLLFYFVSRALSLSSHTALLAE